MVTATVNEQRNIHRVIYRTLPQTTGQVSKPSQHVLKFEMELSCPPSTSVEVPRYLENTPKVKVMLSSDDPNSSTEPHLSQGNTSQPDSISEASDDWWDPSCQVGREVHVNFMLPDRSVRPSMDSWLPDVLLFSPMDIQLCIFDWDDVTLMQQPQALREYFAKLRA